ncbi:hypothetical protein B0H19DRAFT_106750 [Mycena capillaripes]|nr:hypothetical protein B0H19DRAFT_106750 [Mycena capillaripes]
MQWLVPQPGLDPVCHRALVGEVHACVSAMRSDLDTSTSIFEGKCGLSSDASTLSESCLDVSRNPTTASHPIPDALIFPSASCSLRGFRPSSYPRIYQCSLTFLPPVGHDTAQTALPAGIGSQAVLSHKSWKPRQDSRATRPRYGQPPPLCLYISHRGMSARASRTRAYYGR